MFVRYSKLDVRCSMFDVPPRIILPAATSSTPRSILRRSSRWASINRHLAETATTPRTVHRTIRQADVATRRDDRVTASDPTFQGSSLSTFLYTFCVHQCGDEFIETT